MSALPTVDPMTGQPWTLCGSTVTTVAQAYRLADGNSTHALCGGCLKPVITTAEGTWAYVEGDPSMPVPVHLLVVPPQQVGNDCYTTWRAWDHGYTDGRFFNGRRRPGATRGRDLNYDLGFAAGILDRIELDGDNR